MKKGLFFSILFIAICIIFNNCSKAPKFPDTPQIEFTSMEKYPGGDSIVITINFKDGDGDLGLEAEDLNVPEFNYVKDAFGNYVEKNGDEPIFNLCNYKIGQYDLDLDQDTVQMEPNVYYNNYIIEFFEKQPDNSFLKLDVSGFCPNFYQRFPLLNPRENKGPIEGTLSHTVKNLFSGLSGQTLKFKIYIIDRAKHKSNVIETSEIVLN